MLKNNCQMSQLLFFPILQRTEHVTHLINTRFQTQYSLQKVRELRNEININQSFINRLFHSCNFDPILNSYANSIENNSMNYKHFFNQLILVPYNSNCDNCHEEITNFSYQSIYVLDQNSLTPAAVVEGYCSSCHLQYSVSSMESTNFATRYYSSNSINKSETFYVSGKLAFTCNLLNLFTSFINKCACALFSDSPPPLLMLLLKRTQCKRIFFNLDYLSKRFQNAWFSYQLVHFELMLGKSLHRDHLVSMPRSLQPDSRDLYFEESSSYWYHLFVVFWSRHKQIMNYYAIKILVVDVLLQMVTRNRKIDLPCR